MDSYLNGNRRLRTIYKTLVDSVHGIRLSSIPVQFYPQTLEFVACLQDSDALVEVFREERVLSLSMHQLELTDTGSGIVLSLNELCFLQTVCPKDWPEILRLKPTDYESNERPAPERKLVLCVSTRELIFRCDRPFPSSQQYQLYFGGAEKGITIPEVFEDECVSAPVRFGMSSPDSDLISIQSASDFFALEARIHAALSLAHGRGLKRVLSIRDREMRFYGYRKNFRANSSQMLRDGSSLQCRQFLNQLLGGFVRMDAVIFAHAHLALRFFLMGKQAEVAELGFLQAMICVEAMDNVSDLKEETTAALLGVSKPAAKLLNCMRNKLVHGTGGYREAFQVVLDRDFKKELPELETGFSTCFDSKNELRFDGLWRRLCERLDAFWCAYAGVDPALISYRHAGLETVLMPAVDVYLVKEAAEVVKRAKAEKAADQQMQWKALRAENASLKQQLEEGLGTAE